MSKPKVYFTDMRTKIGEGAAFKLVRLIKAAGLDKIDFKNKYVAVKIHFGEPGNLAFLRPNYATEVANYIKTLGGKPFLTDANTLYVGGRKNALDHLESAAYNGYTPQTTGCQILIADGLKGTDEVLVPVKGGRYVKEAKIGRAVMDADILISLNHFKGHECAGMGGALKNIGMGCGSRAGKMEMHSAGKPYVEQKKCTGCGACLRVCAFAAPEIKNKKAAIRHDICVGCGRCIGVCPTDAVRAAQDESFDILNKKIVEYSKAVLDGRPHFHISLAIDISPYCDCHAESDCPIVPNIGMFASFDPVAIDLACAEAVNKQPVARGSLLAEREQITGDHFTDLTPATDWRVCVDYAQELGLGSADYELVAIK
ncbi:MAG: DUF362 domain-containing protein [Elusimicrobiota bacterium]|jgi:uncharacterized Fe-S center protein|nr:DUF362 domain-containing protein [Elusimicrobiota bacterium]